MVNREEAERLLSGKGEDDLVEIDKFGNIWAHGTAPEVSEGKPIPVIQDQKGEYLGGGSWISL